LWVAKQQGQVAERTLKIAALKAHTADWGTAAIAHIFREDVGVPEPGDRLRELLIARDTFRRIADLGQRWSGSDDSIVIPARNTAEFVLKKGRLKLRVAPFLAMFDDIEVARIRICPGPDCHKFFWARRTDKPGCSERCALALRVRRHRQNYAYKKKNRTKGSKTK